MSMTSIDPSRVRGEPGIMRGVPINRETLLVLAWIAGRPHVAELKKTLAHGESPSFLLRAQLISLPPAFELDHYGPVYRALFYHRLAQVDWPAVGRALSDRRGVSLLHRDEASLSGMETTILWDITSQHPRLSRTLHRVTRIWKHDPAGLANHPRIHFTYRQPLLIRSWEGDFLVQELLAISLERIDWRDLAARLLHLPLEQLPSAPGNAAKAAEQAAQMEDEWPQLQLALLEESIKQAERTFGNVAHDRWGSKELKDLCSDLANRCFYAVNELRHLQEHHATFAKKTVSQRRDVSHT